MEQKGRHLVRVASPRQGTLDPETLSWVGYADWRSAPFRYGGYACRATESVVGQTAQCITRALMTCPASDGAKAGPLANSKCYGPCRACHFEGLIRFWPRTAQRDIPSALASDGVHVPLLALSTRTLPARRDMGKELTIIEMERQDCFYRSMIPEISCRLWPA